MMKCKKCGAIISDGNLYCASCGNAIESEPEKMRSGFLLTGCIIAVAVIVVVVSIIVLRGGNSGFSSESENEMYEEVVHQEKTTENKNVVSAEKTTVSEPDIFADKITTQSEQETIEKTEELPTESDPFSQTVSFDQKNTNIYVSNITEVGLSEFVGMPTDDEMLKLALNHSILNYNPYVSAIEYGDFYINNNYYNVRVSADYADSLALRFFGVYSVNTDDDRADSDYIYGNATGVNSEGFAVVSEVYENPSADEYKIEFTVYMSDSNNDSDYYSYSPSQAESENGLCRCFDGYIVLKKYSSYGSESYKIIEYKRTD